ncbi:hypothetical protein SAMN05446635_8397 [Burkholderia sp. OK233]|nr:hypothetical protein SAMN05446635_8397 [Burkholderia sp. OK233]
MVINDAKLRRATVSAALCTASLLSNAVHAADVHVLATGALSAAFSRPLKYPSLMRPDALRRMLGSHF